MRYTNPLTYLLTGLHIGVSIRRKSLLSHYVMYCALFTVNTLHNKSYQFVRTYTHCINYITFILNTQFHAKTVYATFWLFANCIILLVVG